MKVVITDHGFADIETERRLIEAAGALLVAANCKTAPEVIEAAHDADVLLVQWAPIDAGVLGALSKCRAIVRYGIGVDNVDLEAAKRRGIAVCNVPDYCLNEVAEHTLALALSLARQLPMLDRRVRDGVWKITPDRPMLAFGEMTFATAGLGRIAREVLKRAGALGFRLAAYDPFVSDSAFEEMNVQKLSLSQLWKADIVSLHLPLSPQTRHIVNAQTLEQMKPTAIVVNTARGPLVDTPALARALQSGTIAAAGLDVFEEEPLAEDHPLRACSNALLSSHVAWFSQSSVPRLQQLAAAEVVRALKGEPLKNRVNP